MSSGSSTCSDTSSNGGDENESYSKRKAQPYIPSYMDLTNGPEPCVVCGDAATGYHYRCMTCEGCKGFFRRTIQKNLEYHCKWNNQCSVDKSTRNQCQQCRYRKCVAVGMATDLVLNDRQRVAKRRLIEDNRERRKHEQQQLKVNHEQCFHDHMTEDEKVLVEEVTVAYDVTNRTGMHTFTIPDQKEDKESADSQTWNHMASVMTPSIVKVVEFAKRVPGFVDLDKKDQIVLLKACCMEIIMLRAACRYDAKEQSLVMQNGLVVSKKMAQGNFKVLIEPIFEFASSLSKLSLDKSEVALLAAVLLMQSDRPGLAYPEAVEQQQDIILCAFKRYVGQNRPSQPVHWAKLLMKVTDLRSISSRHAERVLCIKLDAPNSIPPLFLDMFDEGKSLSSFPT